MTRNCNSMVVLLVNQSAIINIIKNLNQSSPGWDVISANIIKVTYPCFIEPLMHMLNLSIIQGIFSKELKLTNVIPVYKALENGDYVLGLFLDFSKAFDTVNHDILLTQLECHGIHDTPLQWFKSYLSEREQIVIDNETCSSYKTISCGVPLGSILGLLLFLLYINDLASISNVLFSLLYAEDSNMFVSGKNPDELVNIMNAEMTKFFIRLRTNKLSLNLKKTTSLYFIKRGEKLRYMMI